MATKKEIDRAVRAADRRTAAKEKAAAKFSRGLSSTKTAKSIGLDPEDCCTPSMAGAVLGRLSRKGGMRKSGTTEKPRRSKAPTQSKSEPKRSKPAEKPKAVSKAPRSAPAKPGSEARPQSDENIYQFSLRMGLHAEKVKRAPLQTTPDALFFDMESGLPVGHASATSMFDEAARLGALRKKMAPLPTWTPPAEWLQSVSKSDTEAKFWRTIDSVWPYKFATISVQDWGTNRGGGKRSGGMVTGAMSDPPRGKKVYLDVLARAGFSKEDRGVLGGLGRNAELLAARGLLAGLSHYDALTLGFVGALSSEAMTRKQAFEALRWNASMGASNGTPTKDEALLASLEKGQRIEVFSRELKGGSRKVTVESIENDPRRGPRVYVSSGRVRPGHVAGGNLSLDTGRKGILYQPTLQQNVVGVSKIEVLGKAKASAKKSTPRKGSATRTKAATSTAPTTKNTSEPVRMDHLLDDIKRSAKDSYIPRKFVATALRKMLHARMRNGFSVTTPNHSMATTLDVRPRSGSFDDKHRAALYDVFGDSGGKSGSFMVLVSPFINDSSSVPTGIRSDYADEFRRLVAGAAGLPKPKPYAPKAESSEPKPLPSITTGLARRKQVPEPAASESNRMSDEKVKMLLDAFVEFEDHHAEGSVPPLRVFTEENGFTIKSGPKRWFSIRLFNDSFLIFHGQSSRLADSFLNTFALPMRGDEIARLGTKRSYAWAPRSEHGKRWSRTMSDFSLPQLPSASGERTKRHLRLVGDPARRESTPRAKGVKAPSVGPVEEAARRLEASSYTRLSSQQRSDAVSLEFRDEDLYQDLRDGSDGDDGLRQRFFSRHKKLVEERLKDLPVKGSVSLEDGIVYVVVEPKSGRKLGVGRADHEERRDRRIDRLTSRAAKARGNRDRLWNESKQGLPEFGEPIKVGHHSEKRHRRAIQRAHAKGFKGLEEDRKAKSLAERASAAARNTAISSDDPEALTRLKEKLAGMEAERDEIKRKNRLARAGKLSDAENPENPPHLRSIAGKRVYPMRGYVLKNLGGNIKRVKERIETLSKREGREAREVSRGGVQVIENGDVSRVQIHHDEIPPKEHRVWLKKHGFRWARSEQAWQRQLGDTAWNTAMRYLDEMVEKRDDTPYSRVESSAPKSNYTQKDIDFWRAEYANLDKEFPGEFTEETYERVGQSFRARRAGDPWRQAALYAKHRRGELSLEEAVANLYAHGRRDARPKPRPKRKPATSTMTAAAFVKALRAAATDVRGVLEVAAHPPSTGLYSDGLASVMVRHSAANTKLSHSRGLMQLRLRGWVKDGGPSGGRIKMETDKRGYRGQTATPEKLIPAIVKLLERNVAENWRD